MAIEKPAPWTGASGTQYVFYVFDLEPDVPSRFGSYIYAKRNAEGAWVPLYMGHGDLAECCTDPAVRRCIASKEATHLHLRLNSLEADRDAELKDLLAHYANAFAPEGCHRGAETASSTRSRKVAVPSGSSAPKAAAAKKTPAKKRSAKKTPAKTTPAKKAAARKTPIKAKTKRRRPPSK